MTLTVKKAADKIGVSASLVYSWCTTKRLRHYRVGDIGKRGKILIDEADLDAFLDSLKVEPAAATVASEPQVRRPRAPRLRHVTLQQSA